MDFWTVSLICFVTAFILVIGGALVIYMGALVKSAYQLKIEIKSDVDEGQKHIEEEVDRKIRLIKTELVGEIEKAKEALATDNQRKVAELLEGITRRMTDCETAVTKDRADNAQLLEGVRHDIAVLDRRLRQIRKDQKPVAAPSPEPPFPIPEPAPSPSDGPSAETSA